MEVVVDASVVLAVLLNEPEREMIISRTAGCSLLAPGCLEYEIGNALSALYKRKLLGISEGILVWHSFCKIPVRHIEPDFPSALTIAGTESLYAYDAYYLFCAEKMRCELLTLDAGMKAAALRRGIRCMEL